MIKQYIQTYFALHHSLLYICGCLKVLNSWVILHYRGKMHLGMIASLLIYVQSLYHNPYRLPWYSWC